MIKIKIHVARSKADKQEEKEGVVIGERICEDRRHVIEAAIVKVMKARRKLDHNQLIAETTKVISIKFKPDPIQIKTRIESLIERDFIERDEEDRKIYKYIS